MLIILKALPRLLAAAKCCYEMYERSGIVISKLTLIDEDV